MYQTIKIRMRLSKCQKVHLFAYETIYHTEIDNICHLFESRKKTLSINRCNITNHIKKQSHWAIYQIALRKYKREQEGKPFIYRKSSTWSPVNTLLRDNVLCITYGSLFPISNDTFILCANAKQLFAVCTYEIVRIDFIRDDKLWYANFLIRK